MLAVGANSTAIMAALPNMRIELFLSSAGAEWVVNAYLVVSAVFIVLGGQAADRFGARLASIIGLALFGVGSCIIAVAGTQIALLAGRALPHRRGARTQGSGNRGLDRLPDAWL